MSGAHVSSPDPLLDLLPGPGDRDRPWLVWYCPGERVELTGHVLSMWAAKCAGLLEAEAGDGPRVHIALPVGWRALTWCLGTWLAGGTAMLGAAACLPEAKVSVASAPEGLSPGAEVQVLAPRASLAMRYDGELGPLVLDGAADVMTYPDRFPALARAAHAPALMADDGTCLERGAVVCAARRTAPVAPGAVLVRAGTGPGAVASSVLGVLSAWAGGATAVLVGATCDEDLVALAVRQEGVRQEWVRQ
ncbi:TIGR03089 family protein [Actinomyces sp. W5033]|uniref:TIGR03089 family protein n=1 Tax=Actinomyces sp. W5033 TaxID=3446479 RepID=UPI003EE18D36